jgi:hypothetical protein
MANAEPIDAAIASSEAETHAALATPIDPGEALDGAALSDGEPELQTIEAAIDPTMTDEPIATETWAPKMPPLGPPTMPWRRPDHAIAPVVPSLTIDDADPDSAERVLEERAQKDAPRRSFLPPILLDREDRSGRQGGLTLAVIILLIAATLTLSYLMRRPSASGDGMTRLATPASYVG